MLIEQDKEAWRTNTRQRANETSVRKCAKEMLKPDWLIKSQLRLSA